MANKKTVALTQEQFQEFVDAMLTGGAGFRPNKRVLAALILEANLGIRISDIIQLTPKSFIKDGERYRLNITEQKTGKKRYFTVPDKVYQFISEYCESNHIKADERIFPFTIRNVQKYLAKVADYLDYEYIGTHSFRKFFATDIFNKSNHNYILVQKILQHSSVITTQRYIGIGEDEFENALNNHVVLVEMNR